MKNRSVTGFFLGIGLIVGLFVGANASSVSALSAKVQPKISIDDTGSSSWTEITSSPSPSPRWGGVMTYDSSFSRMIYYGPQSPSINDDTWGFSHSAWSPIVTAHSPGSRWTPAITFDPIRGKTILFGGSDYTRLSGYEMNDTWEFDGSDWKQIAPLNSPSRRTASGIVYRTTTNQVVLFGGWGVGGPSYNDTWRYDGETWTQITTTNSPPGRYAFGVAYDSTRDKIVVYGGCILSSCTGALGDTWEFDGVNWHQITTPNSPGSRAMTNMVFDKVSHKVVLFGGCSAIQGANTCIGTKYDDTWEFDGNNWVKVTTSVIPPGRFEFAMGYDEHIRKAIMFGGRINANTSLGDTWEFTSSPTARIPVVFIPGIMGSNLYDVDENINWLSAANILPNGVNNFNHLLIKSDGISEDCPVGVATNKCFQHTHNQPDGMILKKPINGEAVYDTLVKHFLESQQYIEGQDFWVFNYDWRKDIHLAAVNLDVFVEEILNTPSIKQAGITQVAIVAHSMGGLVARDYISDGTRASKVNRLITLGTPYLGTPKAFAVLEGMACAAEVVGCFPNTSTASKMVRNYPAFYELFPSQAYFTAKGSGYYANVSGVNPVGDCPQCLSYGQTYQPNIATNINTDILPKATEFHGRLDNNLNSSWNNVPLTIIYGTGKPTIAGVQQVSKFSWLSLKYITIPKPSTSMNGDETVTTLSATMNGLNVNGSYIPFTETHGGLVTNLSVLAMVDKTLGLSSLTVDLTTPQKITADPTGAEIVATGVKSIDVTDGAGKHTGPNPGADTIDEDIPGSLYFFQEDLAMVALLGGQNYMITVTPSGIGPVDISISLMTPSGITNTLLYTGVPAGINSRIRMSGDPYLTSSWQFDLDGTGNQITPVDPTLTYSGSDLIDTIPPQASIQVEGTLGQSGWYTQPVTVTLTAADNASGSGVNRIEYSFSNDSHPQIYNGPFVVDPQQVKVLYVIATDQAGNRQTIVSTFRIGPEKTYLPSVKK